MKVGDEIFFKTSKIEVNIGIIVSLGDSWFRVKDCSDQKYYWVNRSNIWPVEIKEKVMTKNNEKFVVVIIENGQYGMNKNPKIHDTKFSAEREAIRLTEKTGSIFCVMQIVSKTKIKAEIA